MTTGAASTSKERGKLWSAGYIFLLLSIHFHFAAFYSLVAVLPLYVAGAREWEVGLVVGSMGISSILIRPHSGRWVDRVGRKPLLTTGAFITGVALVSYALTDQVYPLVAIRLLHGLGMTLFTTAGLTLVADFAPPARRGEAMGFYSTSNNIAQVYAPVVGFTIADRLDFEWLFVAAALSAVVSLMAASLVRQPKAAWQRPLLLPVGDLISRSALLPATVFGTLALTLGSMQAFLPQFAEEQDLGNPGLFFTLFGVTLVSLRTLVGMISDRFGRASIIVPGFAVGITAVGLLSQTTQPALFLLVPVLWGSAFAAGHTGLLALTADRAGPEERGAAMATFALAWDSGAVMGAMGLGIVATLSGYPAVFALAAGICLGGLVLFLSAVRPLRPAESGAARSA